jgi:hypothetical protein
MFNSKCSGMVLTIRVILLVSYKKQELLNLHGHPVHPQRLTVIFSHHQVCVEKKKGGHFLGPKVKVEFRHPFSLRKRFNLWSSHKINANIDRFLLIILFVFTLYLDPTIAAAIVGSRYRVKTNKTRDTGNSRLKIQSEDKQNKEHWQ